jgi:hypothetical protein
MDNMNISIIDFGTSIDELTMFADYRVPQILRHIGVLVYSQPLAEHIDQSKSILYGSQEEVWLYSKYLCDV